MHSTIILSDQRAVKEDKSQEVWIQLKHASAPGRDDGTTPHWCQAEARSRKRAAV